MTKELISSARIQSYGGDNNELRAYTLIAFSEEDNDSMVTLIRGTEERIPRLLERYGTLTDSDIARVQAMAVRGTEWLDSHSLVVRIS